MNERVFHGNVERLRSPERLANLEPDTVVALALEGIAPASVLDIGTGSGVFAERFAARGLSVAGIDAREDMVALARQFVPQGRFEVAPAEALPFPDMSFDLVFFGLVLHEADDALKMLQEAWRVSRQRVAILEWPFASGPEVTAGPPLAHRLRPEQIEAMARAAGFATMETLPLRHVVVYRLLR
jgi:ubiquinone/menaquinone biosynthesis C-methylase UbiE